ncbi:zinc ABC transporter substrate-binding protein [Candidatus Persebacteraceae bacterium Df01]|uniref:High-affinity zinc uptake system protein ZnuA n=1 Tax=Candidatus Doriopsillibacter californiensis TaxID=2970740 RepID=A0ABT7QNC3_9GAMM|nr:zinc ABC transporter substrate-binding protein [Candidatus Persebacteraceae bacterium Df01]
MNSFLYFFTNSRRILALFAFRIVFVCAVLFFVGKTWASPPIKAVASIAPLHSLLQGVMGDVGKASLLLPASASPHHASLRPSDLSIMREATVVFYIDAENFETFLPAILNVMPKSMRTVAVVQEAEISLLSMRKTSNNEHEHNTHDKHDHEVDEHDAHDEHSENMHDDHGKYDWHIWLDTENAKQIVRLMARELSIIDSPNATVYAANARRLEARLTSLDSLLADMLVGAQGRPFVVFHDAYQYFERRYGLHNIGAITAEGQTPSVKQMSKLRHSIQKNEVVCVFGEAQFSNALISVAGEGERMKFGVLDPLGAQLEIGKALYFELLLQMGKTFVDCLHHAKN